MQLSGVLFAVQAIGHDKRPKVLTSTEAVKEICLQGIRFGIGSIRCVKPWLHQAMRDKCSKNVGFALHLADTFI